MVVDHRHQLDTVFLHEMIAALEHAVIDLDVLLGFQFFHQFLYADYGDDIVLVTMQD